MCVFSGLTIHNYKGFTLQASWWKLSSLHQTWHTVSALQSLKGFAIMVSGPLASHALSHIYIPRPGAFIPRPLYLRPWAGVTLTLLPRPPYEGKKLKPSKNFSPLWLSNQDSSTPIPTPPPPSPPQSSWHCKNLLLEAPLTDSHIRADPPDP